MYHIRSLVVPIPVPLSSKLLTRDLNTGGLTTAQMLRISPSVEPTSPTSFLPSASHNIQPLVVRYGLHPGITLNTPTRDVLGFVFAPPENSKYVKRPLNSTFFIVFLLIHSEPSAYTSPTHLKSPYEPWGDLAHKLDDDNFKAE